MEKIDEICDLLDLFVCTDLNINRSKGNKYQICYYIGIPWEPGAGISGASLTNSFFSLPALERYCRSKKGREEIKQKALEIFVDPEPETIEAISQI